MARDPFLKTISNDFFFFLLKPAGMTLLEEDTLTLEDSGLADLSQVLLEVRNKDLTWPEEMSQLSRSSSSYSVKSCKDGECKCIVTLPESMLESDFLIRSKEANLCWWMTLEAFF